jgi:predicted AAA+ superfamily ATPase
MKTVERKLDLNTLNVLKNKNLIKIATGVRCGGKSTLMTQYQDYLRKENDDISKRYTIYAEESYQEVVTFLINSVGSRVSAGNIAKDITKNKNKRNRLANKN